MKNLNDAIKLLQMKVKNGSATTKDKKVLQALIIHRMVRE